MPKQILYPSIEYVHRIHDEIIIVSGGLAGVKNVGLIESVIIHMQHDLYYPTFVEKLTHLTFGLVQNHGYNDANKRTALAVGAYFVYINHSPILANEFIKRMEDIVVLVASSTVSKELLGEIIQNFFEQEKEQQDILYNILQRLDQKI